MNRLIILIILIGLTICSCQKKNGNDFITNEMVIKEFYRIWDSGDTDAFSKVLSADLIDHEREFEGELSDFENMIVMTQAVRKGYLNHKHDLLQVHHIHNDTMMVYWNFSGIHVDTLFGFPPTNKIISFKGVDIFKVQNGLITEIWHVEALHKMMSQMQN